jgi:hypothetical protein
VRDSSLEQRPSYDNDYLLLPRGQVSSRELALNLSGSVGSAVSGHFSAVLGEASGDWLIASLVPSRSKSSLEVLGAERVQYLSTGLGTTWNRTDTMIDLNYRWADGLAPSGLASGTGSYARLDVEVRQGLPALGLDAVQMELLVNVRNYISEPSLFGRCAGCASDGSPQTVTGGVAIRF